MIHFYDDKQAVSQLHHQKLPWSQHIGFQFKLTAHIFYLCKVSHTEVKVIIT